MGWAVGDLAALTAVTLTHTGLKVSPNRDWRPAPARWRRQKVRVMTVWAAGRLSHRRNVSELKG